MHLYSASFTLMPLNNSLWKQHYVGVLFSSTVKEAGRDWWENEAKYSETTVDTLLYGFKDMILGPSSRMVTLYTFLDQGILVF